jgi:hypothetical protein
MVIGGCLGVGAACYYYEIYRTKDQEHVQGVLPTITLESSSGEPRFAELNATWFRQQRATQATLLATYRKFQQHLNQTACQKRQS